MRKIRFEPDADIAMLKLSDTYSVLSQQEFERYHHRPVTPDPRPIARRNDGTVVEVVEEVWDDPWCWSYGVPMVRVFSRTGDMFLVYTNEIHSIEPVYEGTNWW